MTFEKKFYRTEIYCIFLLSRNIDEISEGKLKSAVYIVKRNVNEVRKTQVRLFKKLFEVYKLMYKYTDSSVLFIQMKQKET